MAEIVYSLLILGCSLSMALLGKVVRDRYNHDPVARRFVAFCMLMAAWLFFFPFDALTTELGPRIVLVQIRTAFLSFTAPTALGMVLAFTGNTEWLQPRRFLPLLLIPAVSGVLLLTSQYHSWFVANLHLVDAGFRHRMAFEPRPGFLVQMTYSIACFLLACFLLARSTRGRPRRYRKQALLLMFGFMIPTATDMVFTLYPPVWTWTRGAYLTPLSMLVFVACAGWALFRYRLFDIKPLARAAVMDGMPDAVLVFDAEGRLADLNPSAASLPGIGRVALGRPAGEVLAAWPDLAAAIAEGDDRRLCVEARDQPPRFFDGRLSKLYERDGTVCGQALILRDVTDHKAAQERYRQLLEHNPLGISVVETATGTIVYANQKAADLVETPRREMVGSKSAGFYADPADDERIASLLEQQGKVADFEVRLRTAGGRIICCLATASPTMFDGRACHISSFMDITERKQAEAVLRAKVETEAVERQQRAILDNLPVGALLTAGVEQKVIFMNPRFVQMFGYSLEEAPDAAHWWTLAYPDPAYREKVKVEWTQRVVEAVARQGEVEPMEVSITARDGTVKFVSVHLTSLGDLNINTFIDLTERQHMEEARIQRDAAEAASRAKTLFIANLSHEIRTPLNAILGFAQVLRRDRSLTGPQQDHLAAIHRNGRHLLALVNDNLDLATIEAGRMRLQSTPFDLRKLLDELESLLLPEAREKSIGFRIEGSIPARIVSGDETRLRQVLINLLGNAIKFTREGGVTLCVEALPNGRVRFTVEDTGTGIAPEDLPRLFQPFTQAADGRQASKGNGLGLALSRKLVGLMGGELSARSAPGRGSRFFFIIPLPNSAGDGGTSFPATTLQPGQPRRRVLVGHPEADNRAPLRALLEAIDRDAGVLEIREAADGAGTLAAWEDWQPDVVFVGTGMPLPSGEPAAREIAARLAARPWASRPLVIGLADGTRETDAESFPDGSCDEVVSFPLHAAELFELLERRAGLSFETGRAAAPEESPTQKLATRLAACPPEWLAALASAVDCGDFLKVNRLIEEIRDRDPPLHEALSKKANACDHEALAALLETVAAVGRTGAAAGP